MTQSSTGSQDDAALFAPEGVPIILGFALVAAILGTAAVWLLGPAGYAVAGLGLILTLWCAWFFRDPARTPPDIPGAVISPADGVVCLIDRALPPIGLGLTEEMDRVCVFMNVINVHVNRAPVAGVVGEIVYNAGKFFNAALDKASIHNERSALRLDMPDGRAVAVVQIAGLIARRIVCRVEPGQSLDLAQRYGLIRFGSRVDTYIPAGSTINVKVGDATLAGETLIATLAPVSTRAPGRAAEKAQV